MFVSADYRGNGFVLFVSLQETSKLFFALEHLRCIHCAALQHGTSTFLSFSCIKCVTLAPTSISRFTSSGGKQFCNNIY